MVEVSGFFLANDFVKSFIEWAKQFIHLSDVLYFLLIAGIVLILLSIFIPKPKDPSNLNASKGCAIFGGLSLFGAACILISQNGAAIFDWVSQTFGVAEGDAPYFLVASLSLIFGIVTFLISRTRSKEPNNQSLLNARQFFTVVAFLGLLAAGITACAYFFLEGLSAAIVAIFLTTDIISLVFWFYDPIIYILSQFVRPKSDPPRPPTPNKLNRFAVIGCAHNEEDVIGNLIKSIHANNYPKNKYDLFVICDNCTDNTEKAVRRAGAIAQVRNDPDRRGKAFGLEWMFDILQEKRKQGDAYDAYIILDADNVVNRRYLDAINDAMNEGHEMLQTYLGCKNPQDTWISRSYSFAYWVSDSNYQHAHSRIGLSCQMAGTGMVIRPEVIEEIGWNTDSLTEDLDLTTRYVLAKNRPCHWVHDARLYDEKPLKLKPSIKQRTRWMQGHMATMFQYVPRVLSSSVKNFSLKQFDIALYLMRPMMNFILLVCYVARWLMVLFLPDSFASIPMVMDAETSIFLIISYMLLQAYVLFQDRYMRYIVWLPLQLVFSFTWYPPIFRGIIKHRERYWVSTVHTRNIAVDDIREDILDAESRLEGVDNVHRLPIGQILLKAAVISKQQLDEALATQKKEGGYLGDIIVNMQILTEDTLKAYVEIQQAMKAAAAAAGETDDHLRLGDILLSSGLITQLQLEQALAYQKDHGGFIGECMVATNCISDDLLKTFLEVQRLMDTNYVSMHSAQNLISGVFKKRTDNVGSILYEGGLVSKQQMDVALEHQRRHGGQIGQILIDHGFIDKNTLDVILNLQNKSRGEDGKEGGQ